MAIIPSDLYPSQVATDAAYPHGKARNAGSFQDGTGTPLEQRWVNDDWGFKQALLAAAAIAPSGTPDQVGASQYLQAVQSLSVVAAKVEALKGWTRVSTTITGNNLGAARDQSRALALVSNGAASGTLRVRGDGNPTAVGNISALVKDIARDPATDTYVAAVGGVVFASRSTNFGTSWTVATTKPADSAYRVVWGDGTFLALRNNNAPYTSPTGDVWTLRATAGGILCRSCCATKDAVAFEYLLVASQIAVEVSSNAGATWAAAGVLPDVAHHGSATATGMASVPVGNQVLPFYLANYDGGASYRLYCAAANGTGWAQVSALPMPLPLVGDNAAVRLIGDADTGALLAVLQTNSITKGTWLFLSLDGGITWPAYANVDAAIDAVAMANGRIFISNAGGISMASFDGVLLS